MIAYVKQNTLILGKEKNLIIFDYSNNQELTSISNPSGIQPCLLIPLSNGSFSNSTAPSNYFIESDEKGISIIDVIQNKGTIIFDQNTNSRSIYVQKTSRGVIIHSN